MWRTTRGYVTCVLCSVSRLGPHTAHSVVYCVSCGVLAFVALDCVWALSRYVIPRHGNATNDDDDGGGDIMKRSSCDDRLRTNHSLGKPLDLPRPQVTGSIDWALLPEVMRQQLSSFRIPYHADAPTPPGTNGASRCQDVVHDYRPQWVAVSHQHPVAFNQFLHDACIRNVMDAVTTHSRQPIQAQDHERAMREAFGAAMLGQHLPLPPLYDDSAAVVVDARLTEIVRAYKSRVATQLAAQMHQSQ